VAHAGALDHRRYVYRDSRGHPTDVIAMYA
jgi:hypothetical protein